MNERALTILRIERENLAQNHQLSEGDGTSQANLAETEAPAMSTNIQPPTLQCSTENKVSPPNIWDSLFLNIGSSVGIPPDEEIVQSLSPMGDPLLNDTLSGTETRACQFDDEVSR